MNISPETFQMRLGHEPATADIGDTSDWVSLENADGVLITVLHAGTNAGTMVCTVHEGVTGTATDALDAESAPTSGQEFEIWANTDCSATDTLVRAANGVTASITPATAATQMLVFNVRASALTPGYKWVQLGTASGSASNYVSVLYQLYGGRYQQATPPTDIA